MYVMHWNAPGMSHHCPVHVTLSNLSINNINHSFQNIITNILAFHIEIDIKKVCKCCDIQDKPLLAYILI